VRLHNTAQSILHKVTVQIKALITYMWSPYTLAGLKPGSSIRCP
jgi:hypothetical protein